MRFSVEWLKKWVGVELDAMELAEKLTDSGLEVDRVEPVAAPFSDVRVAEIIECGPHPDADKLKVCMVAAGQGDPLQVVCGAPNARVGLKVPFAEVGAVLDGGFEIRKARLRGVESFGMACSARELGLSDDHSGLMELPGDAPVGADFREYLQLGDHAIELDLTPNRADCLGIIGLAQDVSASCRAEFTPLTIEPVNPSIEGRFDVDLEQPDACARYAGRIIRDIDPNAPTPLWMVERLRRCGVRSISATVDATNYVLLELGQPMHAFDLDKLAGRIIVRRGKPGEKLVLLDEKEVEVNEKLLAICDESGPVALAGIMGGLDTGVTGKTRNILLESAWFRPATISGRARALGLQTDASHRFERGVDPQGQVRAIERITALLLEIAGGEAGPVFVAEAPEHLPSPVPVKLRLDRINRVLGSDLGADEVHDILIRLGMKVTGTGGEWTVTAPSSRFDIAIEEDLIEEVARIHGYNELPATAPAGELKLRPISERRVAITQMREALCAAGYQEAVNYSFVDRELLCAVHMDEAVLPLANPISTDMNVMRTALLPGLLNSLGRNLRRQHDRIRLFETGTVFHQHETLAEFERVGGVACGSASPEQWGVEKRLMDFHDLRKDVEGLLELRGDAAESVEFTATDCPWLHPGQSARISIGGKPAGWAGAVHPGVLKALAIKAAVFAFELDIDVISIREIPNAKNISRFPSVRRDLAFIVPEGVDYRRIRDCVTNIVGDLLEKMIVFDVFSGQSVEKGYKSLAIGLILQDVSCTLTDEVVDPVVQNVIEGMESRLDAQHRG
jgi:phenylalanyl-tRNA synthetase beta chain